VCHLDSNKVDGDDPLEQFGPYAAESLKRLDGMGNCGDLVLISMLDPDTQQVAAFEELIGSHGGLGGPQTEPMLLYPFEWELKTETLSWRSGRARPAHDVAGHGRQTAKTEHTNHHSRDASKPLGDAAEPRSKSRWPRRE
jgi:hypothetical protein